jgi:hypothetical protein
MKNQAQNVGAPPYNKRFKPPARGLHAFCFQGSKRGGPSQKSRRYTPGFGFPAEALRPCSQVIHVLYGRVKESLHKKGAKSSDPISIKSVASGQLGSTGLAA